MSEMLHDAFTWIAYGKVFTDLGKYMLDVLSGMAGGLIVGMLLLITKRDHE